MIPSTLPKKRTEPAPLAEVLTYQNDHVIFKFMENWDVTEQEARDLFEETKKWLWLSADSVQRKDNGEEVPQLAVTFSMTLMDEMWHTFILFTREYQLFCWNYFGFYLNHAPTTKDEKDQGREELESDPDAVLARIEAQTEAQYIYIYDHLGEGTLVKWYSDWTDLVTLDYLDGLRKSPWSNHS
jgi:hypothetical protein